MIQEVMHGGKARASCCRLQATGKKRLMLIWWSCILMQYYTDSKHAAACLQIWTSSVLNRLLGTSRQ